MNVSTLSTTAVAAGSDNPAMLVFSIACLVFIVVGSVRKLLHARS